MVFIFTGVSQTQIKEQWIKNTDKTRDILAELVNTGKLESKTMGTDNQVYYFVTKKAEPEVIHYVCLLDNLLKDKTTEKFFDDLKSAVEDDLGFTSKEAKDYIENGRKFGPFFSKTLIEKYIDWSNISGYWEEKQVMLKQEGKWEPMGK